MKADDHHDWVLSTGRRIDGHRLLLCPEVEPERTGARRLMYGYDGEVSVLSDFTPQERREVADRFIALWQQWASETDSSIDPEDE